MRVFHSDDGELTIDDVIDGQPEDTETLVGLLREFFPFGWKFAPWARERAARGAAADPRFQPHQWLLRVNGEVAGFYIFDYVPARDCGLCTFVGLYPEYRRLRFGGHSRLAGLLVAQSIAQVKADALAAGRPEPYGLVVEVEVPALVERYRSYNFHPLPVTYFEPVFPDPAVSWDADMEPDDVRCEQVTLGAFVEEYRPAEFTNPGRLENWVAACLVDFYGLPEASWPMREALASIHA